MDPVLYSSSLIGFGWRKLKRKFNVNQRMQNRIWNQRRIYGHHQTGGQNEGGGPPKTHFVYFSNGCLPPQSSRVPPDGCWSNVECYWRLGGKTEPEVECHPVVSAESWLCWKVTLLIIQMELTPFVVNLTLLAQVNEQLTVKLNQ